MRGGHQGDGTEGGEEGKGEGGEEILADGHTGQSKVVQEILADPKILLISAFHGILAEKFYLSLFVRLFPSSVLLW